jgi:mRNA interferase YafQ
MILRQTRTFKKDVLWMRKRGKDLKKLHQILLVLFDGLELERKHMAHPLKGDWKGYIDAHVEPDWILIFKINDTSILLARTGSHSDLF